jgi:hypothetical protein
VTAVGRHQDYLNDKKVYLKVATKKIGPDPKIEAVERK